MTGVIFLSSSRDANHRNISFQGAKGFLVHELSLRPSKSLQLPTQPKLLESRGKRIIFYVPVNLRWSNKHRYASIHATITNCDDQNSNFFRILTEHCNEEGNAKLPHESISLTRLRACLWFPIRSKLNIHAACTC